MPQHKRTTGEKTKKERDERSRHSSVGGEKENQKGRSRERRQGACARGASTFVFMIHFSVSLSSWFAPDQQVHRYWYRWDAQCGKRREREPGSRILV